MVSTRVSAARLSRPIGRLLVLLAALTGLLAMHGLSDHGTTSHAAMTSVVSPHGHAAMPAAVDVDGESIGNGRPASGHSGMELCLAILGMALLLWAARRLSAGSALYLRRWHLLHVGAPRSRSPDPPDLLHLSIQRC